jgi:2-hydroxycyclohexanecarboxyl-CoA dehydrogenase
MTRKALVTGGSGGIGAAVAARLAADGMDVVVIDLHGEGAIKLDVTDFEAVHQAIAELGPLAVLVNNAGVDDELRPFTETDPGSWRRMLAVNLEGAMSCTHAALPAMQAAGYGRVVNVASEAGRIGSNLNAAYAAAKGGLIAFTKTIAREEARNGVTCNCVLPGPTDTPLLRRWPQQSIDKIARHTLLRRLGTPEEVAAAVAFLASEDASYITGETLGVSGGMALGG